MCASAFASLESSEKDGLVVSTINTETLSAGASVCTECMGTYADLVKSVE